MSSDAVLTLMAHGGVMYLRPYSQLMLELIDLQNDKIAIISFGRGWGVTGYYNYALNCWMPVSTLAVQDKLEAITLKYFDSLPQLGIYAFIMSV